MNKSHRKKYARTSDFRCKPNRLGYSVGMKTKQYLVADKDGGFSRCFDSVEAANAFFAKWADDAEMALVPPVEIEMTEEEIMDKLARTL